MLFIVCNVVQTLISSFESFLLPSTRLEGWLYQQYSPCEGCIAVAAKNSQEGVVSQTTVFKSEGKWFRYLYIYHASLSFRLRAVRWDTDFGRCVLNSIICCVKDLPHIIIYFSERAFSTCTRSYHIWRYKRLLKRTLDARKEVARVTKLS